MLPFLQKPVLTDLPDYLDVVQSKRARRLALRLDPAERRMKLIVPERASINKAYEFAARHLDWIESKIAGLPSHTPFTDGNIIPLLGEDVTLDIYYDKTLKRTDIILKNNRLSVKTNKEDPTGRIQRFLREKAREVLTPMAREKALRIDKKISAIEIRDPKTRWGSCNEDGKISLSWRLILAPPAAMDYVVAHEVAHLAHLDHSRAFWRVCESLSFDYKRGKTWMRTQGSNLHHFG